jgi:hypothetical protein
MFLGQRQPERAERLKERRKSGGDLCKKSYLQKETGMIR